MFVFFFKMKLTQNIDGLKAHKVLLASREQRKKTMKFSIEIIFKKRSKKSFYFWFC